MTDKVKKILEIVRPDFDFDSSKDFIEDGGLDSFDLINLVIELDLEFGISIPGTQIVPENFDSLESILKLVSVLSKRNI
jgi:acyl carrier protein